MSLLQKLMGASGSKRRQGAKGQQSLPGLQGLPNPDAPPPLPDLSELEASIAAATARADALELDDDAILDASLLVEPEVAEDEDIVIEEGELEELEAELEALQSTFEEAIGAELAGATVTAAAISTTPVAQIQHLTTLPASQAQPESLLGHQSLQTLQNDQQNSVITTAVVSAVPLQWHVVSQTQEGVEVEEEEDDEQESGRAPLAG